MVLIHVFSKDSLPVGGWMALLQQEGESERESGVALVGDEQKAMKRGLQAK